MLVGRAVSEQQHADPLGDMGRGLVQPVDQVEAAGEQVTGDQVGQLSGNRETVALGQ